MFVNDAERTGLAAVEAHVMQSDEIRFRNASKKENRSLIEKPVF